MLKISEIKEYITEAAGIFKGIYPMAEVPEFIVCSPKRAKSIREQTVRECGAVNKKYRDDLAAEVIWGPMGTKILVYQDAIYNQKRVYAVIWRELGHVLFGRNTKYGIKIEENSSVFLGYNLLSEFMAEYIAYTVNGFKPLGYNEDINDRLIQAHFLLQSGDCLVRHGGVVGNKHINRAAGSGGSQRIDHDGYGEQNGNCKQNSFDNVA